MCSLAQETSLDRPRRYIWTALGRPPLIPGNFSKMLESRAAIVLPEQRDRCLYRPDQRRDTFLSQRT